MEEVEQQMKYEAFKKAEERYLAISIDTFIRESKRWKRIFEQSGQHDNKKINKCGRVTYYPFIPSEQVLHKMPFYWFTDIRVGFDSKGKDSKQIVYQMNIVDSASGNVCLIKPGGIIRHDTYTHRGKSFSYRDFNQKPILLEESRFPKELWQYAGQTDNPEKVEKKEQAWSNLFQTFPFDEKNPLEIIVQRIIKKKYQVVEIDAHYILGGPGYAEELLRLYWSQEKRRFLKVEGYRPELLDLKDRGVNLYLDRIFSQSTPQ